MRGADRRRLVEPGFYQAEDQAIKDALDQRFRPAGDNGDFLLIPQNAWNDKLVDVSDVVGSQKGEYSPTALLAGRYYDNVTHKRSFFGVPLKEQAMDIEVWKPMVEPAAFQVSDIPKTWDAYFDFFPTVQTKLRAKGQRVYGLGYSLATKDSDSTYLFNQFLVVYGGGGIVTPDGKLHADDPKVREAAIKALTQIKADFAKYPIAAE